MKYKRVILLTILIVGVLLTAKFLAGPREAIRNSVEPTPTATQSVIATTTPEVTPEAITYDGFTPTGMSGFIEEYPKLGGEQGYVAVPKTIEKDNPPSVIMYYHGSTQKITTNFKDEVMKNMRLYGQTMTKHNVIFLASNQHGDNYGSKTAVEDSRTLINYVNKNYLTSGKIYVLGFSMGGMPAMKHVVLYPKEVTRIALLAPAQQVETYTAEQIKLFKNVPLKIWHGTADANVPYWVTEELQTYFKKQNTPVTVVTLKGKIHWDVDTEYMNDVLDWFNTK